MADVDITSQTMDGMGPHGTRVGLLRVLGPAHVWALGVGIVLVGEYMGWNFAVGKGGAYAALIACWFAGLLYTCVAMIDSAMAYQGIVLPASRYCDVVRLPRLRQMP